MTTAHNGFAQPTFDRSVLIIVGGYGSGKSEVSVNLARFLARDSSRPVAIADLDIVNPYFRSREAADLLSRFGVRSILPPGHHVYADLPVIVGDIRAAIEKPEGTVILDVGGDDVGARVLSSLNDAFSTVGFEMLLVLNARRPFTADAAGALKMMADIEAASRLKFTGIISNTHLLQDTTAEIVMEGLALSRRVSRECGLPVVFASATARVTGRLDPQALDVPLLVLDRALVKPWEPVGNTWTDKRLRIH